MPTYEGGELSKYSAGRILLTKLLDYYFGKAIKIFDFTIGSEEYKKDWCNSEMKLYRLIVPITIKGYLFSKCLKITFKFKNIKALKEVVHNARLFINKYSLLFWRARQLYR